MANFETPALRPYPIIPKLKEGAMAHSKPFVAKEQFQKPLGFPGQLVDNWQDVAVAKMGELIGKYRSLPVFLDSCVKCGACTDKCHYYLGTTDPKNMPVARQDLFRKVYRRHYTFAGKYLPWLVGAEDLTEEVLGDWYTYFHQCSQCRRCSVYCPYGIDTAEISMAAREIMDTVGKGQKYCNEIIGKVHTIGNNLGLPGPALKDTLEGLEEDVKEDTGVDVRYPLDEKGAEVLLITPSADFFAEPHVDGLIGYGKVFHQAGISWTLSTHASEAANFGMFIGSYENMQKLALRIREAALDLGVKRIVFGECGHAWARGVQLSQHARRAFRFSGSCVSGSAAHLRSHLRSDSERRAHSGQVRKRSHAVDLPRFMQCGARLAYGRRSRRPVHDTPGNHQGELQSF
jgi:heterodisulfide reductase subunit C